MDNLVEIFKREMVLQPMPLTHLRAIPKILRETAEKHFRNTHSRKNRDSLDPIFAQTVSGEFSSRGMEFIPNPTIFDEDHHRPFAVLFYPLNDHYCTFRQGAGSQYLEISNGMYIAARCLASLAKETTPENQQKILAFVTDLQDALEKHLNPPQQPTAETRTMAPA